MNLKFIRKSASVLMLAGALLLSDSQALAADTTAQTETTFSNASLAEKVIGIGKLIEENMKDPFSDMAFLQLEDEDDFVYIRKEADKSSKWLGVMYSGSVATVIESDEEWTKIESGDVTGYVKSEYLVVGKIASMRAETILKEKYSGIDVTLLDEDMVYESFTYAVTRADVLAKKRQAVVDYAEQFIGNPYVYGGTSLTRGADCSGFVKSVYANFGVSLPRTSYGMRSVGVAVSYSDIQPGDIICYPGHVGIYAGNGMIVNAIDSAHGIGMSSARYTNIVTIRRVIN